MSVESNNLTAAKGKEARVKLSEILLFMNKQIKGTGPLSDLIKSGAVLIALSGGTALSFFNKTVVKLSLTLFLKTYPELKGKLYFTEKVLGLPAIVVGCTSSLVERKAFLSRATADIDMLAEEIRKFPQPIVMLVWNDDHDLQFRETIENATAELVGRLPEFGSFQKQEEGFTILFNEKEHMIISDYGESVSVKNSQW